jgi:hypothetical protein
MADGNNMNGETVKPIPSEIGEQNSIEEILAKSALPDGPDDFAATQKSPRSFINPIDLLRRREIRKDRQTTEIQGNFDSDSTILVSLVQINESLNSTNFTLNPPTQLAFTFEDIEKLKKAFEAQPGERNKIAQAIRKLRETTMHNTFGRLTGDIRMLNLDRGATEEEADQKVQAFTYPLEGQRNKQFGGLDKEIQLDILRGAQMERGALLIGNVEPHYLYFLHGLPLDPQLNQDDIEDQRRRFREAESDEKIKIAATLRRRVVSAQKATLEANIPRFKELGRMTSGYDKKFPHLLREISALESGFASLPLPSKNKAILDLLERKTEMATDFESELSRLQRLLEIELDHGTQPTSEDNSSRIHEMTLRIEDIIKSRLKIKNSMNKITEEEMDTEIRTLIGRYGSDAEQADEWYTGLRVFLLLRDAPSDILYL